jgi:hypothetical protein
MSDLYMSCGLGVGLALAILTFLGQEAGKRSTEGAEGAEDSTIGGATATDTATATATATATDSGAVPLTTKDVVGDGDESLSAQDVLRMLQDEDGILAKTSKIRKFSGLSEQDVRTSLRQTRLELEREVRTLRVKETHAAMVTRDFSGSPHTTSTFPPHHSFIFFFTLSKVAAKKAGIEDLGSTGAPFSLFATTAINKPLTSEHEI